MGEANPKSTVRMASRTANQSSLNSWRFAAWMSGGFCLLIGLILMVNFAVAREEDPLRSPELKELKQKLQVTPADEGIKERIRELDLKLREKYFRHLEGMRLGGYLLLAGVTAFLIAAAQAFRKERALPQLKLQASDPNRALAGKARWSVTAAGGIVAVLLLVLSLGPTRAFPKRPEDIEKLLANKTGTAAAALADYASDEEMALNWPRLLGPNGNGSCGLATAPTAWDAKTGAGVAWKTPTPAPGFNSPIVWNERVFLSGGDTAERSVFCLDGNTGRVLWQKAVTKGAATVGGAGAPEIPESTGYAASTMATDGKRVFVIFATGDLAAFDLTGELLWSKCLGPLKNTYGHASSLLTWKGRLFAQVDQGESEQGKSRLYAFDCRSGEMVWQQSRSVGSSWSTPALIDSGGKTQIITVAVSRADAYAADTGVELWRVEGINGEVTPSPIGAAGLVFVISPSEKLMAIRPDGQGDITKTHVSWNTEDNVPDITSPTSDGELVFTLNTGGLLTCYDAKDGKKQWTHEFDTEFHTSPSIAGKALYLFSLKGQAIVVEVARQFKELLRTEMPDSFSASPAFAQDHIYLRGATNLWCIGPLHGQLAK